MADPECEKEKENECDVLLRELARMVSLENGEGGNKENEAGPTNARSKLSDYGSVKSDSVDTAIVRDEQAKPGLEKGKLPLPRVCMNIQGRD